MLEKWRSHHLIALPFLDITVYFSSPYITSFFYYLEYQQTQAKLYSLVGACLHLKAQLINIRNNYSSS